MSELPYQLERTVVIRARPETVFQFFTDNQRWASWWGAGSTIDAQPAGKVYIRHPDGTETIGEVLDVCPPDRISFSYGFASGQPIPAGGSRVTIQLEPSEAGTRLHLRHEFAAAGPRDEHIQGWRFQLSLFSNAVANEVYQGAEHVVDAWFEAWTVTAQQTREEMFARIASPAISFRDRFSLLASLADLNAHVAAAQRFMPGMGLKRKGNVRHCQGSVLADWAAIGNDGQERMSGTSAFELAPDLKIQAVTGFTNAG